MDAETQPDLRLEQFPRNLFFQAVDYQVGPAALPETEVKVIQNRRYADNRRLHAQLEHLVRAVKAIESFDPMGNAGLAAVNLGDLALDVHKQIRNFIREVEKAEDRYGDAVDERPFEMFPDAAPAVVEPTPQAPTAAGPKPGPSPIAVINVHNADDVAQVKANLNRALDRAGVAR